MDNQNKVGSPLDLSSGDFRQLLHSAVDTLADFYDSVPQRPAMQYPHRPDVKPQFQSPLPEQSMDPHALLAQVRDQVFESSSLNISDRFFAYVMSCGTHVGVMAELLAAGLNQNVGKWHLAPPIVEMEQQVIRWLSQFIGYREDASGVLVSGGSAANLTCLTVARKVKTPWNVSKEGQSQHPPLVIYGSTETHSCVHKSVEMMGIGTDFYRKIPTLPNLTIDLTALEASIEADLAKGFVPFCVVGNGGTVNTGAIDPLEQLADLCERYNLWFHVDGAYGVPAAGVPEKQALFKGLERADSVAIDPHKWFYVPFEAGCALIRNRHELRSTYSVMPDYLNTVHQHDDAASVQEKWDPFEHIFQLSRNAKALKVWMTLMAYGATQLRDCIRGDIARAETLRQLVEAHPWFEVVAESPLSILCFRYVGEGEQDDETLDALNLKLLEAIEQDGEYFLTGTKIHGRHVMRMCCVSHRATDATMAGLLGKIDALAQGLEQGAGQGDRLLACQPV